MALPVGCNNRRYPLLSAWLNFHRLERFRWSRVRGSGVNPGPMRQSEAHRSGRSGWLRAAVLGSDDAIVGFLRNTAENL